jgi:hypothetical protein
LQMVSDRQPLPLLSTSGQVLSPASSTVSVKGSLCLSYMGMPHCQSNRRRR